MTPSPWPQRAAGDILVLLAAFAINETTLEATGCGTGGGGGLVGPGVTTDIEVAVLDSAVPMQLKAYSIPDGQFDSRGSPRSCALPLRDTVSGAGNVLLTTSVDGRFVYLPCLDVQPADTLTKDERAVGVDRIYARFSSGPDIDIPYDYETINTGRSASGTTLTWYTRMVLSTDGASMYAPGFVTTATTALNTHALMYGTVYNGTAPLTTGTRYDPQVLFVANNTLMVRRAAGSHWCRCGCSALTSIVDVVALPGCRSCPATPTPHPRGLASTTLVHSVVASRQWASVEPCRPTAGGSFRTTLHLRPCKWSTTTPRVHSSPPTAPPSTGTGVTPHSRPCGDHHTYLAQRILTSRS